MSITIQFKDKKDVNAFILEIAKKYGNDVAAELIDELAKTGFLLATLVGQSMPVSDFVSIDLPKSKNLDKNKFEEIRKQAMEKYKELSTPDNQTLFTTKIGAARGYDNIVNMFATRGYFVNALDKYIDEPVVSSLAEGVDKDEFYNYGNAARKGIMDRVKFTAQPGYLFRQLVYLAANDVEPDTKCKPKGLLLTKINKSFIYRYVRVDGKDILLTPDNIKEYEGKTLEVYSPLYCTYGLTKFCNRCVGELHRFVLNSRLVGITAASVISEFLYTKLLKSMHTGARGTEYAVNVDKLLQSIIEHKKEDNE
jgi:DNA-directed RNA polymerase beta' subunit